MQSERGPQNVGRENYCARCDKQYACVQNYKQHLRLVHSGQMFICDFCHHSFYNNTSLRRHVESQHAGRQDAWTQTIWSNDSYNLICRSMDQNGQIHCGRRFSFSERANYEAHIRMHPPSDRFGDKEVVPR